MQVAVEVCKFRYDLSKKDLQNMTGSYCLELSGGLGWNISASPEASGWVNEFARILSLRACRGEMYPNLIVDRRHETGASEGEIVLGTRFVHFYRQAGRADISCNIGDEEGEKREFYKMWEFLLPVYEGVMLEGGLPIHAALLENNGKGILLCGLGGTGKSTCARRVPSPWRALSDDECLIVKNGEDSYMVHPLPTWSDYLLKRSAPVWDVSQSSSLSGIFFLKQADIDEAVPLGRGEASMRIYDASRQVCQYVRMIKGKDEERARNVKALDNIAGLVQKVPSYILNFSISGNFWEEIERVLPVFFLS
jgi:SynChlorMet cassette protein ScmC